MPSTPDENLDHQFLRVAIEAIDDAVEVSDATGVFRYVNPAWERLTGYSLAEAFGRPPSMLRSGFHPDEYYQAAWDTLERGHSWTGMMVSRRKDGGLIHTWLRVYDLRDDQGAVRFRVAVRQDLTEDRRHTEALRVREEQLSLAMQASRDGLCDWDLRSGHFLASDRWKAIVGATGEPHELAAEFLGLVHPDDLDALMEATSAHLASREAAFTAEYRIIDEHGAVRIVESASLTVRDEAGEPRRMVSAVSDITDRKHAEAGLFHSATHDPLTDLPNRALFVEHLRAAIGRAGRDERSAFCLLYIDLRDFKLINDGHGHSVGDQVLCSIAERLRQLVRPGDSLARLGGDEFAVLLAGVSDVAVADTAARRLLRRLEQPHHLDGLTVAVSATIGVAMGDANSEVDRLVRAADTAMYNARKIDHKSVGVATPDATARSQRRARMVVGLREALTRKHLDVMYQPVVDLRTGVMIGAEALVRWYSVELGTVSPVEFVPLAEDTQLAARLGQFVLDRAVADLGAWESAGVLSADFTLHVNVSPRQLLDPRLPAAVARLHESGRVRRDRLCFEITETALIDRPELVVNAIHTLREFGVQFALDDFGTGYSSLSHLRGFAVSTIKIDRSFVALLPEDAVTRQIVAGLLTMTEALGLVVVAEGVETESQQRCLLELGCSRAQGYRFARPMPAAQLHELLVHQAAKAG